MVYTMTRRAVTSAAALTGMLLAACGGREAKGDWTMRVDTGGPRHPMGPG
jgi:hypothetical protein